MLRLAEAKGKPRLTVKSKAVTAGLTLTVTLKNAGKTKWTTSNKKVLVITKCKKNKVTLKAKKVVCIMAIHALEDTLTLINGEELNYATRRRKEILAQLQEKQRKLIESFAIPNTPKTPEEYHAFYRSFMSSVKQMVCPM